MRTTMLLLWLALSSVFFPPSIRAQETCVVRSVEMLGPGLVHLACGQPYNVQVIVRVEKSLNYQGSLTVNLWADDLFFDDLLDQGTILIPAGPPQDQEFAITFPVQCQTQVNGRCRFMGSNGIDDDDGEAFSHRIYATAGGKASLRCEPKLRGITVYCDKPNGQLGCIPAHTIPGSNLVTLAKLSANNTPVRQAELYLMYDPTLFALPTVNFTQEFAAAFPARNIQVSEGLIIISGLANNPTFVNGGIVRMSFPAHPQPQAIEAFFEFDPVRSQLRGPDGRLLDTGMGVTSETIVPQDLARPTIQAHLLSLTHQGLFGAPGAIQDDNLWVPGWVRVSLGYACGGAYEHVAGAAVNVNPDGSFQIPGPFRNGLYRLMAVDLTLKARMLPLQQLTAAPAQAEAGGLFLFLATSNPATRRFELAYGLPDAGATTLSIVDASGREIVKLLDRLLPSGSARIAWDGRDARGADVPAGVYFARLQYGGRTDRAKLVLAR